MPISIQDSVYSQVQKFRTYYVEKCDNFHDKKDKHIISVN